VLYNDDDGNPANGWEGFGQTLQISAGVGVNPSAVAVGLLDGDAQPDIAVANRGDDTVSLLLVTDPSPGSFATVGGIAPVPVGDEPADVIIADLDQDGLNDIATANAGDHTITFAPNEGPAIGPSWERVDPVPIGLPEDGECPLSIRPGDTDAMLTSRFVATANAGNGSIGLVQINPDRTFVVLANVPTDAEPRELIVADLDGDGRDDIATVNRSRTTRSPSRSTSPRRRARDRAVLRPPDRRGDAAAALHHRRRLRLRRRHRPRRPRRRRREGAAERPDARAAAGVHADRRPAGGDGAAAGALRRSQRRRTGRRRDRRRVHRRRRGAIGRPGDGRVDQHAARLGPGAGVRRATSTATG
jgi:hypothetical protein